MTLSSDFHRLSMNRIVHKSDPDYQYKLLRMGEISPNSPVEKADILIGRVNRLEELAAHAPSPQIYQKEIRSLKQEAKALYFKALRHKEDVDTHVRLVSLLTAAEAQSMYSKYRRYPNIRAIYRDRLNVLGQRVQGGRGAYVLTAIAVTILLLLIGFVFWLLIHHWDNLFTAKRTNTSVTRNYTNDITYIDQLPSIPFSGTLQVPDSMPEDIGKSVDRDGIPAGQSYLLHAPNGTIGYVTNTGSNHYLIRLLNSPGTPKAPPASVPATSPVNFVPSTTPFQLNVVRTAYTYYLRTHGDVPPHSLKPLQSMVPQEIQMGDIRYKPTLNPQTALTLPGQNVPFVEPQVDVNLSNRTLSVLYHSQPILQTKVGIGSPAEPTPTGTFTITDRIPNDSSPVYGDYILPLNNSSFAIHGTNVSSRIGNDKSLGCIETPNPIDDQLYRLISVGTPVLIHDKGNPGTTSPHVFR